MPVMGDLSNAARNVAGEIKQKVGEVTGDDELAGEGQGEQVESKAKQIVEDAKDKVQSVADKVTGMFSQ